MHLPCHPGEIIREEVITPLGLDITCAADVLKVARPTLSKLLNEKPALTPEMAIHIEKAFGLKADHLMRMQAAYNLARARLTTDQIDVEAYNSNQRH